MFLSIRSISWFMKLSIIGGELSWKGELRTRISIKNLCVGANLARDESLMFSMIGNRSVRMRNRGERAEIYWFPFVCRTSRTSEEYFFVKISESFLEKLFNRNFLLRLNSSGYLWPQSFHNSILSLTLSERLEPSPKRHQQRNIKTKRGTKKKILAISFLNFTSFTCCFSMNGTRNSIPIYYLRFSFFSFRFQIDFPFAELNLSKFYISFAFPSLAIILPLSVPVAR